MAITLPPLPFDAKALEPYMSATTLGVHHGKHHAAYVDNYNKLIKDTPFAGKPLEAVIVETARDPARAAIFNNAAQAWNHAFFWNSLAQKGGGKAKGKLTAKIDADFGGYEKFAEAFKAAAVGQFGSGWAWLLLDKGKLAITHTSNADTPLVHGQTPLIACDVWEHAYYLDYQNRRPDFVQAFLDHLLNWSFAERNLETALHEKAA
jgi:Fe-Mn family superoxide dismutase